MGKEHKSKRAVVLFGSPRHSGNTATVLHWLEDALEAADWKLQRHELYRMDFRGCVHCDHCKPIDDRPGCKLKDDLRPALDDIARAAVVVVASPVYCWSVSGCTSAALDRFYCFFKESGKSLIAGKKLVGVFTAGGDAFDGMDLCVQMLKRLAEYGGAAYAGTLAGVSCDTPKKTTARKDLRAQARELARSL